MGWFVWLFLVPSCIACLSAVLLRVVWPLVRAVRAEQARDRFRRGREWLEARFLNALARIDATERLRWEEAHWSDEVVWARDRLSGRLLALVGVEFDPDPFDELPDHPPRCATVVFEYDRGRWRTEGERLDEIRPHEAFQRRRGLEPFSLPQRRT